MNKYYLILSGAGIGGRAGAIYIKEHDKINILTELGWIENWETVHFTLKKGEFTDFPPTNVGCRLCSEKLKSILERCKSEKDILQWLDAEVENEAEEKRRYYILHFPVVEDLLDKKNSKYVRNILTKQFVDEKRCIGHEVFSYKECSSLSFVVSGKVKEELRKENCRGLIYSDALAHKKGFFANMVRKLPYNYNPQKKVIPKEKSQKTIDITHLEMLNLPNELIDFICKNKFLFYDDKKCTIGRVELVSVDSLDLGRIYVEPVDESLKKGYYTIPAVDLIAECEGFDSWGILVWLPDVKAFGTWDSDHRKLRIFDDATWSDIVNDPIKYLDALWNPQKVKNRIFEPNDNYSFTDE